MSDQEKNLIKRIAELETELENARRGLANAHDIAIKHTRELFKRQRQSELLGQFASITANTESIDEAMRQALRLLCDYMNWPVAHFLLKSPHLAKKLASSDIWVNNLVLPIDDLQRLTREKLFDENSELPGAVIRSGQPCWWNDIDQLPDLRASSAARCGLQHALALPIQVDGDTVAILEFFSQIPIETDTITKEIVTQASAQLARIFERKYVNEVRQLYAEQLEKNVEQLSRIAHIGSHDLQEPLRKIEIFMSRLQKSDAASLSRNGKESLDKIGIAARRMSALVRDLLELVYVATDHWDIVEVDLSSLVERIREVQTRRELGPDDAFIVESDLPCIWSEAETTAGLFEELLDNAVQFRAPDRPLQIQIEYGQADPGFFEISIRDNGIGFSPEYAEQIFKPFQLLSSSDSEERTGIGLALCRRTVERLGGTLTASSDGPQSGARFTIRLPNTAIVEAAFAPDESDFCREA